MTNELRERIKVMKQAAEKATPGPWRAVALLTDAENHHVLAGKFSDRHIRATEDDHNGLIAFADLPVNTDFIATCNPAAVSALITEVERLERENATLKDFIVEHHGTEPPIVAAIEDDD